MAATPTKDIQARRYSAQAWRFLKERFPQVNLEAMTEGELARFAKENNLSPKGVLEFRADDRYLQSIVGQKTSSASQAPSQAAPGGGHGNISGIEGAIALGVALANRQQIELLEDDEEFKKIEEDLKKKWLEKNKKKDFYGQEGLDYLYGSLSDPTASNLKKEAEAIFRETKDKNGKLKFAKKIAYFDKKRAEVKKDPKKDQALARVKLEIEEHKNARLALLRKTDPKAVLDKDIIRQIEDRAWDRFVQINPQKAEAYKERVEIGDEAAIKSALKRQKPETTEANKKPTEVFEEETTGYEAPSAWAPPSQATAIEQQPPVQKEDLSETIEERTIRARELMGESQSPAFGQAGQPQTPSPPPPPPPQPPGEGQGPSPRLPRQNPLNAVRSLRNIANILSKTSWALRAWILGWLLFIIGSVIFIISFGGIFGGQGGTSIGGGLDYTIRMRDTSILPQDKSALGALIRQEFPLARLDYWDTIVSQAIANGWNPAFVLALWIEETGASAHTKIENGGGGTVPLANGHLGCAPSEDQTIDESLRCLFKNFNSYTNDQFEQFMRRYSGEAPSGPFVNNKDFPSRLKRYYLLLVPGGEGLTNVSTFGGIVPSGVGGERIASAARQIAEQLVSSDDAASLGARGWRCDLGGTFGKSFHCWDPAKMSHYDQAGNPGYLECTEFVWAVFGELGSTFERAISLIRNHNAFEWVSYAQASEEAKKTFSIFSDATQLKAGDIISAGVGIASDGLPWGHVAIVIERLDNVVTVAQASTAKPIEEWYIENGTLVSPFKSQARSPIRGFFRLIDQNAL